MLERLKEIFAHMEGYINDLYSRYLWEDYKLSEIDCEEDAFRAIERLAFLYREMLMIFHHAPDSIFIADNRGVVKYLNQSYEAYTGTPKDTVIGRNVMDLEAEGYFKPSAIRLALEEKREIVVLQNTDAGDYYVKSVPVIKNGQIEMVITSARPMEEIEKFYKYPHNKVVVSNAHDQSTPPIFGQSRRMREIREIVEGIKDTDATVLITGESGVGKGVLVRYIHDSSKRSDKNLVLINCGAIPKDLIESELFGYESGAFTGAHVKGKEGLFELADGGTLVLDEISEMPTNLQVKLLQVIQEKQIRRIGGKKIKSIDVRIIAVSNKDLFNLVREGKFREDLYFRLNVIPINVPSLRERKEDIILFADHFLKRFREKYNKNVAFSKSFHDKLQKYDWPGNIRELENCIERLVLTSKEDAIDTFDLMEMKDSDYAINLDKTTNYSFDKIIEEVEAKIITAAYEKYGSSYKVAKALGISQTKANRKIRKYVRSR